MANNPFFSVIIPTYNRSQFISKAIYSILDQEFSDYEIIVVDDGSSDNTEEVITSIRNERLRYFKKENGERAAARNYGAKLSSSRYVNFLDSDDFAYPSHLKVAHEFIIKNDNVEIFHLGYDVRDEQGKLLRSETSIQNINRQIAFGNILSCNGVFIRRDILLENQFNEDRALSSLEDWELWIRMSARFHFFNSNQVTSAIVLHEKRSVVSADLQKLKLKADHFVKYVSEDEMNKKTYNAQFKTIFSSIYMYTALHLAMIGESTAEVLKYLSKGVWSNINSLFTKRFLVIVKLMIMERSKS